LCLCAQRNGIARGPLKAGGVGGAIRSWPLPGYHPSDKSKALQPTSRSKAFQNARRSRKVGFANAIPLDSLCSLSGNAYSVLYAGSHRASRIS
jgi:hypothetical protein